MNSRLSNLVPAGNRFLRPVLQSFLFFIPIVWFFLEISGGVWSTYNYRLLDPFYKLAISNGYGPQPSFQPGNIYLTITDDSYRYFKKNFLDRKDMAGVNHALASLGPEAIIYDIIFAHPSSRESDGLFCQSIAESDLLFLPLGCAITKKPYVFQWYEGEAFQILDADTLGSPKEQGDAEPFYAARALTQLDVFAAAARGSGNISAKADDDGVFRHAIMAVRVDERILPSLSLSVFLDWLGVRFDDLTIVWGKHIMIPSGAGNRLEKEIKIPIDKSGRTFIPFVNIMGDDFPIMPVHSFLEYYNDQNLKGNLADLFEGSFVWIADTATGISDLGATPLETAAPLLNIHASMLNAMLTDTFYDQMQLGKIFTILSLLCLIMVLSALQRASWVLYCLGPGIFASLFLYAWFEFINFSLFPIITVQIILLLEFITLVSVREIVSAREKIQIQSTFSRYVSEPIVKELLKNPKAVKLGGEEREATVLFVDLADFTSISEQVEPETLVMLLNEFFTEMTDIIQGEGGIIDKYLGDAIMAEFGIPLNMDDHADRAVTSALKMKNRLSALENRWVDIAKARLRCRIGINTGKMITGNMGSKSVMDYTVIGDAVNLASRLEGVNKFYNTTIVVSEHTLKRLTPGRFRSRTLDVIQVKGKSESIKVFEVYGDVDEKINNGFEDYYITYDRAFDFYLIKDFDKARKGFLKALSLRPEDPAASGMIERIAMLDIKNLPDTWNGAVKLSIK